MLELGDRELELFPAEVKPEFPIGVTSEPISRRDMHANKHKVVQFTFGRETVPCIGYQVDSSPVNTSQFIGLYEGMVSRGEQRTSVKVTIESISLLPAWRYTMELGSQGKLAFDSGPSSPFPAVSFENMTLTQCSTGIETIELTFESGYGQMPFTIPGSYGQYSYNPRRS
jgi:hypothetical protein